MVVSHISLSGIQVREVIRDWTCSYRERIVPVGRWGFGHDFRALPSQVRHHLQTPRTAVRPSSLRSVPSGLPMTTEKTQKEAAVQAKRRIAMLRNGERIRTPIEVPTL